MSAQANVSLAPVQRFVTVYNNGASQGLPSCTQPTPCGNASCPPVPSSYTTAQFIYGDCANPTIVSDYIS
jgi:hypothetical protein